MLNPGQPAPDFTLTTHEGKTVSLKEFRGRKVLLWFYPKADTPGCTIEGKGLRDRAPDFARSNIVILGASFDTQSDNAAFAQKFGFPFPLLCDTDRSLGMAYGACDDVKAGYAKRISYLIDEQGNILKAYLKVQPADHPQEVLQDDGAP